MAWTLVKETFKQTWEDNINGKRGIRIFYVVSDTKILDNDDVLNADDGTTAIPSLQDSWSLTQIGVTVSDRRVKELDNGKLLFNVEVEYQTPAGTGTSGSDNPNPLTRPWEISTTTFKEERNIEKTLLDVSASGLADINLAAGVSIVNAASDPLEVRGVKRKTIITLTKNYADFSSIDASITDLKDLKAYEGKLNDLATTIADITGLTWTWLIDEINVVNARENETDYIRVTYKVIYDEETHVEILLNAGFNKIVDDGGTKVRKVINVQGKAAKQVQLLDVNGEVVAPGVPPAVATGTYVAAGINEDIDFGALNLPLTFN